MILTKYQGTSKDDAYFHKAELEMLYEMAKDNSIPHMIFYGPDGSGMLNIINIFLEMIYTKDVHNVKKETFLIKSSKKEVEINQSNYHIVIDPMGTNFDKNLIQEVVKEYATRRQLFVFKSNRPFKTVVINNIDNLSIYAQASLRRTLEIYSNTCRFIMWSNSLQKVIDPLQSRCSCFRIKQQSDHKLTEFISHIAKKEKIKISGDEIKEIIEKSAKNINKICWYLENKKHGFDIGNRYDTFIEEIVSLLLDGTLKEIGIEKEIRIKIYWAMITNIDGNRIIIDIVNVFMRNDRITNEQKIKIVELAAKYETNIAQGRRDMLHIDAFIVKVYMTLHTIK